jgi:hypothetical protein
MTVSIAEEPKQGMVTSKEDVPGPKPDAVTTGHGALEPRRSDRTRRPSVCIAGHEWA